VGSGQTGTRNYAIIGEDQNIMTSGFQASNAYGGGDIARLLQSSGPVLSLTLGDLSEDSVVAVWSPSSASRAPLRRIVSALQRGPPRLDRLGRFQCTDRTIALSAAGPAGSSGQLQALSTLVLSSSERFRRHASTLRLFTSNTSINGLPW